MPAKNTSPGSFPRMGHPMITHKNVKVKKSLRNVDIGHPFDHFKDQLYARYAGLIIKSS